MLQLVKASTCLLPWLGKWHNKAAVQHHCNRHAPAPWTQEQLQQHCNRHAAAPWTQAPAVLWTPDDSETSYPLSTLLSPRGSMSIFPVFHLLSTALNLIRPQPCSKNGTAEVHLCFPGEHSRPYPVSSCLSLTQRRWSSSSYTNSFSINIQDPIAWSVIYILPVTT